MSVEGLDVGVPWGLRAGSQHHVVARGMQTPGRPGVTQLDTPCRTQEGQKTRDGRREVELRAAALVRALARPPMDEDAQWDEFG